MSATTGTTTSPAATAELWNLVDARLTQARAIADLLSTLEDAGLVFSQAAWGVAALLEDVQGAVAQLQAEGRA